MIFSFWVSESQCPNIHILIWYPADMATWMYMTVIDLMMPLNTIAFLTLTMNDLTLFPFLHKNDMQMSKIKQLQNTTAAVT